MCLIVFAWQQHASYPLLLAANRDEFHARPAAPAQYWEEHPELLAGRDLEAGGTWLGVSRRGRFAAITNIRDPQPGDRRAPRSRGDLTRDFLLGTRSPADYLNAVAARADEYLGFNLLLGDGESLWYLHAGPHSKPAFTALEPGIYGLSNAALDVPWPKVERAQQWMAQLLDGDNSVPDHAQLRSCVSDRRLAAPGDLAALGLEGDMAQPLSAQFIVTPHYGTRCQTTLRWSAGGELEFEEQRFGADGDLAGSDAYAFSLDRGN
jgi:uncharacterized protein with NRDE domain